MQEKVINLSKFIDMEKEIKIFVQCEHESGKTGTFAKYNGKFTKCYKSAFELFMSKEYKELRKQII
jgi:hypothetical protein